MLRRFEIVSALQAEVARHAHPVVYEMPDGSTYKIPANISPQEYLIMAALAELLLDKENSYD